MSGISDVKLSLDHPGLVHLIVSASGEVHWSNRAAVELAASTQGSITTLADLVHADDRSLISGMLVEAREHGRAMAPVRVGGLITNDLRYFQLILTVESELDLISGRSLFRKSFEHQEIQVDDEPEYMAQAWDITTLVERQHELEVDAYRDALTGVANRRTFMTNLDQELDDARHHPQSVAVLFADVDDFTKVNDTYGHVMGDLVLVELAARLLSELRSADTLGRIGGDEFAVICPNLSGWAAACSIVERLRLAVAVPMSTNQGDISVTMSVGIAFAEERPARADAAAQLVALADTRMFRTKFAQR